MPITIDEFKRAKRRGDVSEPVRFNWKKAITELFMKEKKFLTPAEIRNTLNASNQIYAHLYYFNKNGILVKKVIGGEQYYGLPEFLGGR